MKLRIVGILLGLAICAAAGAQKIETEKQAEALLPEMGKRALACNDSRPEKVLSFTRRTTPGLNELLGRPDLWKGVLHVYAFYGGQIRPTSNTQSLFNAYMVLGNLGMIYNYPEFQAQLKGREGLFFQANLNVLKNYLTYVEDEVARGKQKSVIFGPPFATVACAMELARLIDPAAAAKFDPELKKRSVNNPQDPKVIRDYLKQAMGELGRVKERKSGKNE